MYRANVKKLTFLFINSLMLAVILLPTKAFACSVCFFGSSDKKTLLALQMSVITLLAILLGVLGLLTKFFLNIRKRAQLIAHNN